MTSSVESVTELRDKIVLSCRMIGSRGVSQGSFGHVSARIPGSPDRILIKSKGPDEEALEFTTDRDIITLDLSGRVLEAPSGLQAPAETAMHLAIYRARPEINSVIHSHPLWVVVLTACDKPLVGIYGAYDGDAALRLLEEGLPTFQGSQTITDDTMAAEFLAVMGNRRACLLRGHGMTVAGTSVEDATATSLTIFELSHVNYLAYAIGVPSGVPDLDAHRSRWGGGRRNGGAVNAAGESFTWRYNKKLLGP
ncbi:MAG TPA: class II aldolase/adducin family protein [Chloroflexota bacterium]